MALLTVNDAATAIQEQTIRRPFPLRISEGESVSRAFFNFWCCKEIWFGLNRTGHPDWVKMFGDSNGQIELRAKKKKKNTRFFLLQNLTHCLTRTCPDCNVTRHIGKTNFKIVQHLSCVVQLFQNITRCLHTVKCFQVLQSDTNNSICTQ